MISNISLTSIFTNPAPITIMDNGVVTFPTYVHVCAKTYGSLILKIQRTSAITEAIIGPFINFLNENPPLRNKLSPYPYIKQFSGIEPLITEVTRFLGTGFYRNLSYQAIPAVPAVVFVFT